MSTISISRMAIDLLVNSQGLEKEFRKALKPLDKFSKQMGAVGKDMTMKVTAPIAGMGVAVLRSAGDFEAGMNRVQAITGATSGEFELLRETAKELGATTQFSATEAASGIEMLAKNGMKFEAITQGALDATLLLSASTGKDLSGAADIATDAMALFNLEAGDMMDAVNGITGVALNSKFGIDDYAYALANGGATAASVGRSFDEFNAMIAATASSFSSGMTAGTSFKTLLTRLSPDSDKAAATMERLGLNFFDASGKMKSMVDVADLLQDKLSNLSDEDRITAVKNMFGTEGMKAALALMRTGGDEIKRMQGLIGDTSAQEQAEIRMQGLNGALKRLQSAAEALAIAIAESGVLDTVTGIVKRLSNLTGRLSETNPQMLKLITIVGAAAAAIGPLALAFSAVASAVAPVIAFIAAKGGLVGALALLTNPIGIVVAAVGGLTAAWVLWGDEIKVVHGIITDKLADIFLAVGTFVKNIPSMLSTAFNWITDRLADFLFAVGQFASMAIDHFKGMLKGVAEAMKGILKAVGDMVTGVKDWLGKKLSGIIDGAINKVKNLGQGFKNLFQKVVGGSYVPDMVDGLGREFKRMDSVFINPSIEGVKKLQGQFEKTASAIDGMDFGIDAAKLKDQPAIIDKVLVKPTKKALKDSEREFGKSSLELNKKSFELSSTGFVVEGFKNLGLSKSAEKEEDQTLSSVLGRYEDVGEKIGGIIKRIKDGTSGGLEGVVDFATQTIGEFKGLFKDLDGLFTGKGRGSGGGLFAGGSGLLKSLFGAGGGGLLGGGGKGAGGLFGGLFGGGSSGGGGLGGILKSALNFIPGFGGLSNLFGGFFAAGGDPPRGRLSLVGEEGPELIAPRSRMRVLPNSAYEAVNNPGGGGKTVNVHLTQNNNFESGIGSQDVAEMLRMHGKELVSSMKDQIERGGSFRNAFKG